MALSFSEVIEEARQSARALLDYGDHFFNPTVRLGVTGLSRAVDISELRLVIDYQRKNGADRTLTLDIVDYPGEWLLDLPLLNKSYEQWSAESLSLSRERPRAGLAAQWHAHLATLNALEVEDEQAALTAARLFTEYLRTCRDERFAMSLLPPGRFLMPGNLAGSPALTFAPLDLPANGAAPEGSLWAMMRRRYEAYKDVVVRPFFRDHFSRLDRQVVLVDALSAFNSGPEALVDLEAALAGILDCFRIGRSTLLSSLFRPRIDRILFAATKADHLPPPRPITCIIRAMIVSRRCCGEPSTGLSQEPRTLALISTSWHSPRCAPPAKRGCSSAAKSCPRSSAPLPPVRRRAARRSTGRPKSRPFRAICRPIRKSFSWAKLRFAASPAHLRKRAIFAFCVSARRRLSARASTSPSCLTSASTAPSSS